MDTMFQGLTVEKYTISMWRFPTGWWVTVRAYDEEAGSLSPAKHEWMIPIGELKAEDLLHLWEAASEEIYASTP